MSTVPLPPLHEELVGRAAILQHLQNALCQHPTSIALVGLPGAGKTSLANALVYDPVVAAAYPDGILWAGLGATPDLLNVLTRWALAVGMLPSAVEKVHDAASMAQAVHRHIGHRRLLFILDDAWQLDHALLCQVGGPQCAHILTTRSPRVAEEFAPRATYAIEELDAEDGVRLLQRLAPKTAQMFPQRVQSLVAITGGLPLALSLIGHSLYIHEKTGRPQRLQGMIERLEHDAGYLHLEQPRAPSSYSTIPSHAISLAQVIAISVQSLPSSAQKLLQNVALFPVKPLTFPETWAQAISGWDKEAFLEALDILLDAGLVTLSHSERYTLHQAIADYARLHMADQAHLLWNERFLACALTFAERHSQEPDQLAREEHLLTLALEVAQRMQRVETELQLCLALRQYAIEGGRGHLLLRHLEPLYQHQRIPEAYTIPVALCVAQVYRRRGRYAEAKAVAMVG